MSSALRPLTQEDLRAVHELLADPAVVRYMLIPLSASIEDSQQFLTAGLNENQPVPQCWRSIMRAIVRGSTVVGLCGIVVQIGSEEGEIWYLVDPRRQCRGIATQAVLQLLAFAFETLGLHRVFACCVPDNAASAKVLRKVGMRHEGLRRRNLKIRGEWMDSELYAMLDDEWETWGALTGAAFRCPAALR